MTSIPINDDTEWLEADGLGGFGSAFDEDLANLEEIGAGGGDPGFAEELAELDVPDDDQQ